MVNYTKKISPIIKSLAPIIFALILTSIILIPAYLVIGIEQNIYEILLLSSFELFLLGAGIVLFMYIVRDLSVISSKLSKYNYDYFEIIHWKKLSYKEYFKWIFVGIILLLSANFSINMITSIIGVETSSNVLFDVADENPEYILYFIPVMLLLIGPVEELMFRGILQSVLRESYGMNIGLFIASLVFGLIHIPAAGGLSQGALVYVLVTFTLGYILGYIYEYKKSLLIPILIHGIYNAILLIGFYYVQVSM